METSTLNVRIPADLHRSLRIEAAERGMTMQQLVGKILADRQDTAKVGAAAG